MMNGNDENISARQRAREIRNWLEQNGAKRVFSEPEAHLVAGRIDECLRELRAKPIPKGTVAGEAFNQDPTTALSKLRFYTAPMQENDELKGEYKSRRLSRKPFGYSKLAESIAKWSEREEDSVLIEIFAGTPGDPKGIERDYERAAVRLEFELNSLAARLSNRLDLARYYREIMTYGALRDLGTPEVRFDPERGGDLVSLTGDPVEAGILGIEMMGIDQSFDHPHVYLGRLPAVPLYRIALGEPIKAKLSITGVIESGSKVESILQPEQEVWVTYYRECRFGVAPRGNGERSGMMFEWVLYCVVSIDAPDFCNNRSDDNYTLWPELAYEIPIGLESDREQKFYLGDECFTGCLLGFSEEGTLLAETLDRSREIFGFDPGTTAYFAATPTTCRRFLWDWPKRFEGQIQSLALNTKDNNTPLRQFFPPETFGEVLERQLISRDRSPETVEGRLIKMGEDLKQAFDRLRRESANTWDSLADGNKPGHPADDRTDVLTQHLTFDPKQWRLRQKLTQAEAARLLQVEPRSLRNYERDANRMPHTVRLAMLYCLAEPALARAMVELLEVNPKP